VRIRGRIAVVRFAWCTCPLGRGELGVGVSGLPSGRSAFSSIHLVELPKSALRSACAWAMSVPLIRSTVRRLRERDVVSDRFVRHAALRGDIPITSPWTSPFLMRSDARNMLVRRLYFGTDDFEESETFAVFVELIDEADVFVDVGANQGIFTLVGATRNSQLRIFSFEPNPNVHALLRTNVAINDLTNRVTVRSDAVSDRPGEVAFHVPPSPFSAIGALADVAFRDDDGITTTVPAVRLDDVLATEDVDVIKIDVEGAEARVIEGAQALLRRTRPAIIMEVLEPHDYARAERLLRDLGYRFFHLTAAGPLPTEGFVPDTSRTYRNYLCLPAERPPRDGHE
jgi:FkbM family methyltransferase